MTMAVSPARLAWTSPVGETVATASSLVRSSDRRVMSSSESSAKVATTRSWPFSPAFLKAYSGGLMWICLRLNVGMMLRS